ncbi:Flp family type IVb pilin [Novosphingobium sp. ZN18A2]|uniref:Flp family type IVb pilin n=1 Tax=Novosphingobium sp. ZN18A2 TaxID=3079861 RepID=UPI0030CF711E
MGIIKAILQDDSGATAIEYALLVALISLTMVFGLNSFGNSLFNMYTYIDNSTTTAIANAK